MAAHSRDRARRDLPRAGLTRHHFVFIGGLHRSGTSLLAQCVRQHPLISGFQDTHAPEDEGQHLQSVYPPAKAFGGPGRFGFDPRARLDETSHLVTPENGDRLFADWSRYWDLGKPFLLEKSPPNLIRTRFLQALFPACSFLIILRHPLAVAYATRKWRDDPIGSLLEHWLVCHETCMSDLRHLARVHVLSYEEFIRDPEGSLRGVYQFVGLEPHSARFTIKKSVNESYLAQWHRDVTRDRRLEEDIQSRFGERIARFGYSLQSQ